MRKIIATLFLGISFSAFGQIPNSWSITEVTNAIGDPRGYILHTESIGRQVGILPEKSVTGLRILCSVVTTESPIIGIYWNSMTGSGPEYIEIKVDGKKIGTGEKTKWDRDSFILYQQLNKSSTLLQAMKTGRTIHFSWESSGSVKRETAFDLRDFNAEFPTFNEKCKNKL